MISVPPEPPVITVGGRQVEGSVIGPFDEGDAASVTCATNTGKLESVTDREWVFPLTANFLNKWQFVSRMSIQRLHCIEARDSAYYDAERLPTTMGLLWACHGPHTDRASLP